MTNGSNDRLHRMDDDLENIKVVLMATARRAESNSEAIGKLTTRFDGLTGRVDQLTIKLDQLTERVEQMRVNVNQTTANVDNLAVIMVGFAESAQADRVVIRGLQTENRQILEYLFGQQRNGNGGGPQP